MPTLVTITGPIAAGKNTVAELVAEGCVRRGLTAVLVDIDEVAAMVAAPGAGAAGLWFAAHQAHGALVAQWMRSAADVVISVGPVYSEAEQAALFEPLPPGVEALRVLIDAPVELTWARARADLSRGLSRERTFHVAAHERFRSLLPGIVADLRVDAAELEADEIAATILHRMGLLEKKS